MLKFLSKILPKIQYYKNTQRYMEDNYEKIPEDRWENMEKKQENRRIQAENLVGKLEF